MEKTILFGVRYRGNMGDGFIHPGQKDEESTSHMKFNIELPVDCKLSDLARYLVENAMGWDEYFVHLHIFYPGHMPHFRSEADNIYSPGFEPDWHEGYKPKLTTETSINDIGLKRKNMVLLLEWDLGDQHHFKLKVKGFGKKEDDKKYPIITGLNWKKPRQYSRL